MSKKEPESDDVVRKVPINEFILTDFGREDLNQLRDAVNALLTLVREC